jgi:putative oxidoreductase
MRRSVPATILAAAARAVLGVYLFVHGAQKLFGWFGGHGLDATATGFERMGLKPGREMATLAGASEMVGGALMATGIADPLGPITIAGTMTVASAVHRPSGPLLASGGFELPLTNLAFAALAGLAGGPRLLPLPKKLSRLLAAGAIGLTSASVVKVVRAQQAAAAAAAAAVPAAGEVPAAAAATA